jgi:hypothetical protein
MPDDELEWLCVPRWWLYLAMKHLPADMVKQLVRAREDANRINTVINSDRPEKHRACSCIPRR